MVGGQDTIHWSKRYNVFVEYTNRKSGEYDKDMQMCEDIIEVYQKERYL